MPHPGPPAGRPPSRRSVLAAIALLCLTLQAIAASVVTDVQSPNAATVLAQTLLRTGEYSAYAWQGPSAAGLAPEPLKAYLLPGEPLVLAAGFRWLPEPLWPYLHVPVTTLLVTAITGVGLMVGGWRVGLLAGLIACLDPFVLAHGPVWDDTFLAAALVWSVGAGLVWRVRTGEPPRLSPAVDVVMRAMLFGASLWAALTRTSAQLVLLAAGILVLVVPGFRSARRCAVVVILGVIVGVGAWGGRNQRVLGELFFGTSHDGITLLESNSSMTRASILATGTGEGMAGTSLAARYDVIRDLGELEANAYLLGEAWAWVRAHPTDALLTSGLKTAVSLTGVDFGEPLTSIRNLVAVPWNVALWTLALGGLGRRRHSAEPAVRLAAWLALATGLLTLAVLAAGPVGLRYRLILAGVGYVLAARAVTGRASLTASHRSSAFAQDIPDRIP